MLRLLAILSALFLAGAASATTLWVDAPRDGHLNLRTGPSTQYNVIYKMPHGTRVTVLAAPGKWLKVRHNSGVVGWAHSRFLSETRIKTGGGFDRDGGGAGVYVAPPASQDHGHGTSPRIDLWVYAPGFGGLNLRAGPGSSYPVLLTMQQREKVVQLGRQGKWIKVRHRSGKIGWAHGEYLVRKDPGAGTGHGTPPWTGNGWGHNDLPSWAGSQRRQKAIALVDILQRCLSRPPHRFEECIARNMDDINRLRNW